MRGSINVTDNDWFVFFIAATRDEKKEFN